MTVALEEPGSISGSGGGGGGGNDSETGPIIVPDGVKVTLVPGAAMTRSKYCDGAGRLEIEVQGSEISVVLSGIIGVWSSCWNAVDNGRSAD